MDLANESTTTVYSGVDNWTDNLRLANGPTLVPLRTGGLTIKLTKWVKRSERQSSDSTVVLSGCPVSESFACGP